jgi:long-chain acyl-CoA synthetase
MLAQILPRSAARFGSRLALVTDTRALSYVELDALSDRVAAALASRGILPGNRVSLYSQNRWEWIVAYHGILKAGAVVNPINVMLTANEVRYVLADCGARAIFCGAEKTPAVLEAVRDLPGVEHVVSFGEAAEGALHFDALLSESAPPPEVPAAAPAALSTIGYTSGTTGHPKGAMQSHRAVFLNCALSGAMHVRTERDVVVTALPAPHVYGNVVINSLFMAGGTVVLMERFDPEGALERISRHRATLFEGVPAMYMAMLAHPALGRFDLSSLTRCTVGGQTIAEAVMRAWEERARAPLVELWGMTELAGLGTTHALYAPNVHGSIGVGLPGVDVRVASFDDPSRTMPAGEPGELMVRGPIVMLGYYGNDKATRETIEPDGWLHTGDVAVTDDAGYFRLVDRRKDMILTAGYNVYPAEIERVLAQHPAVAMSAVGPVEDEVKGELARAYVVLRPGASATEAELIDFCRPHLAAYKLPRSVRFVTDLPKTSTGKIMRRELRKLD